MSGANGGSFDHLIVQLDRRLERIESTLDRIESKHDEKHEKLNGRISDLEKQNAEASGAWKLAGIVGAVAGTVAGIATKWFS